MPCVLTAQEIITGKVINVLEGDKIVIVTDRQESIIVKLADIDCPEEGQPYWEEAIKKTEKLCYNKEVQVRIKREDREGIIGIVSLKNGKIVVNQELAAEGYAWDVKRGLRYDEDVAMVLENIDKAKEKRKGIWKEDDPTPPWEFRKKEDVDQPKTS